MGRLINAAIATIRIYSVSNCLTNCGLEEPIILRTPISFNRVICCAILKLIKLMIAMTRIKTAIQIRV
ncbi:hypothetical protein D3C81_1079410 [compost metagenome]